MVRIDWDDIKGDGDRDEVEVPTLFAPRYKKYAAWPVVFWCRLNQHFDQPRWGNPSRCLRCGDVTL